MSTLRSNRRLDTACRRAWGGRHARRGLGRRSHSSGQRHTRQTHVMQRYFTHSNRAPCVPKRQSNQRQVKHAWGIAGNVTSGWQHQVYLHAWLRTTRGKPVEGCNKHGLHATCVSQFQALRGDGFEEVQEWPLGDKAETVWLEQVLWWAGVIRRCG